MKKIKCDIVAMAEEPIAGKTPEEIREFFSAKNTEQDLADAFAITSNQFFWVADNIYDYEEGTPEYKTACEITDAWCVLMDEYEERIFAILTNEGVTIPSSAQIRVLIPFMARNGYRDANGWWIKEGH